MTEGRPRGLPSSWEELASVLRVLRGTRSLSDMANEIAHAGHDGPSRSALGRFERGTVVSMQYAGVLDRHYDSGSGWLYVAIQSLHRGQWEPWSCDEPATIFTHAFPAEYRGKAWIWVRPNPYSVGCQHDAKLAWGPWRCFVSIEDMQAPGVALGTYNAPDPRRTPLIVTVNPMAHVRFIVGSEPPDCLTMDISDKWIQEKGR